MTSYVVGFAFADDLVVLITKDHPQWQAGRLNGPGGEIKPNETARQAMAREFEEETGLATGPDEWMHYASLRGADFLVYFFTTDVPWLFLSRARTVTPERVSIHDWHSINATNAIPNITWLLPMARNLRREVSPRPAHRIVLMEVYE
jgi:8-oxo-dGTP pyrophosphatase MutT (NUDIX family)